MARPIFIVLLVHVTGFRCIGGHKDASPTPVDPVSAIFRELSQIEHIRATLNRQAVQLDFRARTMVLKIEQSAPAVHRSALHEWLERRKTDLAEQTRAVHSLERMFASLPSLRSPTKKSRRTRLDACQALQTCNRDVTGKAVVRLGLLLPRTGWSAGKFIMGAATLAIDRINADPSLMPDRHIEYAPPASLSARPSPHPLCLLL